MTNNQALSSIYNDGRRMTAQPVQRIGDDENKIGGYGVVFDQRTVLYDDGEYKIYEEIKRESVDGLLDGDVICCYNHENNYLLGRTSSNTLSLRVDDTGVFYEVDLPNTSYANDVKALVERGDVKGSSFQAVFDNDGVEVSILAPKEILITVSRMAYFKEVGPVYTPAYPQTTAEMRKTLDGDVVKRLFEGDGEMWKRESVKRQKDLRVLQLRSLEPIVN